MATYASLTIPWTVKRAIDALQADARSAPVGHLVTLIALSALLNGVARLGSRFAITGGCQHIESEIRGELFAALQRFPPRFYATHSTGDLMARSTSDITAVRSLLGFGALSLVSTTFSFVGVLAAMLAVDPWLTLWSLAPSPVLVLLARRFNTRVNERTQAAQDQLSVLSERVQEYVAGMSVVRAYTLEPRARADFGRANAEYLRLSLALARTEAGFSPLMGLIAGIGTLIVIWAGGRAVVDGRLTLGALVAFNGYLAYLTWPTLALGWTLSTVRRGLTSMGRILEIVEASSVRSEPATTQMARGARGRNFYNDIACRYGYEEAAKKVQDLYLAGRKPEAEAAVPDALVDEVALCGPRERIRELVSEWRSSGVTTLMVAGDRPAARTMAELAL